jgi:hypothetical protein
VKLLETTGVNDVDGNVNAVLDGTSSLDTPFFPGLGLSRVVPPG